MASMLMVPVTNALTTTYATSVVSSSSVNYPNNALNAPDGTIATVLPGGMLVVKMGTTPPSGAQIAINAYSSYTVIDVYCSSTGTGNWHYRGYIIVSGGYSWFTCSGSAHGGCQYFGFSNVGSGYCYIDSIRATY